MSLKTLGNELRVAQFVSRQIGRTLYPPFTTMGLEKDGEVVAGVIFNCFEKHSLHVTIAGHGWSRGFLADVGHYVFTVLKKERITVVTEQPKVVRIAERLGGQVEGLMRNQFGPGRDGFLIGVLKHEYRF